ncbi:hypothetical protein G5B31_20165 [Rhodobacter sp. SGA-6-6]|uniref:hypothetical protein n=1 Tax=Rhodobacter sp. SGA-6-6 TaxID=2710882 RepID=UPI0013EAC495|nr:hypothetical protein [Rhodobacter sp. SGA-6-6]NGM47849.1 hypothetical protein [Rhodobacter sp. SGA-6-6]
MAKKTATARAGCDWTSLYDKNRRKMIGELWAGRITLAHPQGAAAVKAPVAMAKKADIGRHYSGINVPGY